MKARTRNRSLTRAMGRYGLLALLLIIFSVATAQPYQESPLLMQRVAAGELPPVAERLPSQPMVVPVVDRVGTYGGTLNLGIVGIAEFAWVFRGTMYEPMVRWNDTFSGAIPNVARAWDISDDASTYTFYLREGMRWSDGTPFTSQDVLFWFEHVVGNPTLYPAGQPTWLRVNGQPAVVTAPDDTTVVIELAGPNSLFMLRMATAAGKDMIDVQAAYASQFHIDHNPNANQLAQENGFSSWSELFASRVLGGAAGTGARAQNPELPTLTAWRLTAQPTTRIVQERNPYYFKVDAEGNQLPYLDGVVHNIVESPEVLLLRTMSGEIDLIHAQGVATEDNKVLLIDNEARGQYGYYEVNNSFMNQGIVALNLTHKDPIKREVFSNPLFRQALSVAIDRQEIIDLLWVGQGEPWQAAPRDDTPFFDEVLAKQFTEYDPGQAAAWLDEAEYTVGPGGWRVGPDGAVISLIIETSNHNPLYPNVAEQVVRFWRAVGIDAQERSMERSLWYTRKDNNDQDANIWIGGGGDAIEALLDPRWYFPYSSESNYAIPWGIWFNDPANPLAQEPPANVQRQMTLYRELLSSPTPEAQWAAMSEILAIARDNFHAIGIARQAPGYGVVSNHLHNVPASLMWGWTFQDPGSVNPEQFFKTR